MVYFVVLLEHVYVLILSFYPKVIQTIDIVFDTIRTHFIWRLYFTIMRGRFNVTLVLELASDHLKLLGYVRVSCMLEMIVLYLWKVVLFVRQLRNVAMPTS